MTIPNGVVRKALSLALGLSLTTAAVVGLVNLRDQEQGLKVGNLPALPAAAAATNASREAQSEVWVQPPAPPDLDRVDLPNSAKAYRLSSENSERILKALAEVFDVSCRGDVTRTKEEISITDCPGQTTDVRTITMTTSVPHSWYFSRISEAQIMPVPPGSEICRRNPGCAPDRPCTQECYVPPQEREHHDLKEPIGPDGASPPTALGPTVVVDDSTRAQLQEMLRKITSATDVEVGDVEIYGSDNAASARAELRIGDTPLLNEINVHTENDVITSAGGVLLNRTEIGDYPLVSKAQLLERIEKNRMRSGTGFEPAPPYGTIIDDALLHDEGPVYAPGTPAPIPDNDIEIVLQIRGDVVIPVFRLLPSGWTVDAVIDDLLEPADNRDVRMKLMPMPDERGGSSVSSPAG